MIFSIGLSKGRDCGSEKDHADRVVIFCWKSSNMVLKKYLIVPIIDYHE